MAEINITDSITNALTNALTNVIKKGRFFEKKEKYKKFIFCFIFFTMITNTFLLTTNIYNSYILVRIKKYIKNLRCIEHKIENLNNENTLLRGEIMCLRRQINNFNNIEIENTNDTKKDASTFITVIIHELIHDLINKSNDNLDELYRNELLDECYENIPCNNIKKYTLFNRLFS